MTIQAELQTSRQASQWLLCSECEQRFHREGEDWVLRYSARDDSTFKLREVLLLSCGEHLPQSERIFRCGDIPELNVNALCYFALSVIWRASVRDWRIE